MTPSFGELGERLRRSTVRIGDGRRGGGSGVIWDAGGLIVTNAHVAGSGKASVELWDGRVFEARVTARNPHRDLASLRIPATALPAAVSGNSSRLRPGELVIAVGNPMGFIGAISTGVVCAVGRVPGLGPNAWVHSDVRLAPGNSGGPLANAEGRVVGINAMVANGIGLSVPGEAVARFLEHGPAPQLGVVLRPVSGGGLLVLEIVPGSAAAAASLMPGDVLVGAEGKPFRGPYDLGEALEAGPGLMRLQFVRGDPRRTRQVTVRLREQAEAA